MLVALGRARTHEQDQRGLLQVKLDRWKCLLPSQVDLAQKEVASSLAKVNHWRFASMTQSRRRNAHLFGRFSNSLLANGNYRRRGTDTGRECPSRSYLGAGSIRDLAQVTLAQVVHP